MQQPLLLPSLPSTSHTFNLIQQGIEKDKPEERKVDDPCVIDTVFSHDQTAGNYVWLQPYYGKLLWVDFEEPPGSGKWRTYDRYWWTRHGAILSHEPHKLYEEHVKHFINPQTKIINLLFWFQTPDGNVYSTPPTEEFYRLEAEYFQRWQLCVPTSFKKHQETDPIGPEPLYCENISSK